MKYLSKTKNQKHKRYITCLYLINFCKFCSMQEFLTIILNSWVQKFSAMSFAYSLLMKIKLFVIFIFLNNSVVIVSLLWKKQSSKTLALSHIKTSRHVSANSYSAEKSARIDFFKIFPVTKLRTTELKHEDSKLVANFKKSQMFFFPRTRKYILLL